MWGMVLSSGIPIGRQVKGTRSLQQAPLRCRRCSIISCSDEVQLMEGHPLLRVVENWQGRGPTQLAFEARGFTIHKARQSRIIQFCGEQQSHLLNRYWDEVALETMQSLGQGNPDTRGFVIQPRYRSVLLDELFAARDFVEPPFRSPPLVKCLFDRSKRIYLDAEFRENEVAFFSHLQKVEGERLGRGLVAIAGFTDTPPRYPTPPAPAVLRSSTAAPRCRTRA